MKIIDKFVGWYLKKKNAAMQKEKQLVDDAKLVEAYKNINALYDFVKFLRTQAFKNRDERKRFWKDILDEKPVVDDVLNRMLQAYGVKSETIKKLEEARIKNLVEQTKKEAKDKAK